MKYMAECSSCNWKKEITTDPSRFAGKTGKCLLCDGVVTVTEKADLDDVKEMMPLLKMMVKFDREVREENPGVVDIESIRFEESCAKLEELVKDDDPPTKNGA